VFQEDGGVVEFMRRLASLIRLGEEEDIRGDNGVLYGSDRGTWTSDDEGGNDVLGADWAGEGVEICYVEEARSLHAALRKVYPGVDDIDGEALSPKARRMSCAVM
jgi:hypothetical protein